MKGELLILFVILLLGLILCSFLGGNDYLEGMENNSSDNVNSETKEKNTLTLANSSVTNYDNYNHYNGSSYPNMFYGPNGGTARVIQTPNNNTIVITNKNGTTEIYYIDSNNSDSNMGTYHGQNGGSAKIITDNNGKTAVEITMSTGEKMIYSGDNIYSNESQDDTINQYDVNTNTIGSDVTASHYGPYATQSNVVTGPSGNTYSTYDSSAYLNSLPQGIPRSQIPSGEEDLYILKSQVVPPVCPKCPDPIIKSSDEPDLTKCPPCPPCGRCPEPSFDCKKVPNYNAFNQNYMPVPVLSDFSNFGM